MPSEFAHKNNGKSGSAPAFWVGILVVCLLVALILGTIFVLPDILSSQAAPEWTAPPQTENSLQTPVLNTDATEAAAITPIPSPTVMQTETPTTEPTALPQVVLLPLETKLGTSYKVIIHRVADGESLSLLAELNKTWDQAILDATYKLTLPLTIGKIIVIPVDNRSWKEHPPLEPYQVPQTAVSFDELGALLGVDAKLLKYYNGYEDYLIQQGSWIVVPRAP